MKSRAEPHFDSLRSLRHEGWQIIFSGLKTLLETGETLRIEWPEEVTATG